MLAFQSKFLGAAADPAVSVLVFCAPRGAGKSFLAAEVAAAMLPDLSTGEEIVLAAPSLSQARIAFRFARQRLGEDGYRYQDSAQRIRIVCKATGAEIRCHGSSGKSLMGLTATPLAVVDEPASFDIAGGELMYDAVATAQGKPGSNMKVIYCGTLAPFATAPGHWYHDLVFKPRPGKRVMLYQGDREKWRDLRHVYSVNPLAKVSPELREQLRIERDEAVSDSRLLSRFLSYRLNVPSTDEATMLLSVDDWQSSLRRPVGAREGKPIVGIDLGHNRAWSAAVGLWRDGTVDAVAVAPGVPSLADQAKRDGVPRDTYAKLRDQGTLLLAEGLRVPPAADLVDAVVDRWGAPEVMIADRFRVAELRDCNPPCPVIDRVTRWSDAAADIRAVRKYAKDGPLSVCPESRDLLTASLAAAVVKSDDQGSTRLVKRGTNNQARDDVAAALTLAAGALSRAPKANGFVYHGKI